MVREVFSINGTQDQRVTFSLIFHTERESQPLLLTHITATVPALQGSQWKLCISHLLHHMCVAIIIIIILLQMGHFSLHGWLLFQYFLLSSPNMQRACAPTPPQQWTRCQIKSAEGARRVSVTYWFCGFIQPQSDSHPRQPPSPSYPDLTMGHSRTCQRLRQHMLYW